MQGFFDSPLLAEHISKFSSLFGMKSLDLGVACLISGVRGLSSPTDLEDDPRCHYVGASMISERPVVDPNDSLILHLKQSKKVVYISMGTVVYDAIELYKALIKVLSDFDGTVVVSVGRSAKLDEFGNVPPHIKLLEFVPQLDVLEQTDVFVTHGGWNSINESLYYGVPMLLIPQMLHADQPLNATRMEEIGVGLHIHKTEVTEAKLNEGIHKLLNEPKFSEECCKWSKIFQEKNGVQEAIELLMNIAKQHKK